MDKHEAHRAYTSGKLHPHCPKCGNPGLVYQKRGVIRPDGNYWRKYMCRGCKEQFGATVEKPESADT